MMSHFAPWIRPSALAISLFSACSAPRPAADAPVPIPLASAPPSVVVAMVSASGSASAPAANSGEPDAPDCSDEAFERARTEVTRAKGLGKPELLRTALEAALSLRAYDAALRRDLMLLRQTQGDWSGATAQARILVEVSKKGDPAAWWLLGKEAESAGQHEEARAFFARSAFVDPAGAGAASLGARSRCTTALYVPPKVGKLTIVTGFRGVFAEIEPNRTVTEDKPWPSTEAEAKQRACANSDLERISATGVCKGPGPWTIQTGRISYHNTYAIIVPLLANRFAIVDYYTIGHDGCSGAEWKRARRIGGFVEVYSMLFDTVGGGECNDGMDREGILQLCIQSQLVRTDLYDATTGAALVSLEEHDDIEKHELKGSKLRRWGPPGCDETIDLRRLPANLTPMP